MGGSLWERCRGEEAVRRITGRAWRVVEGQHVLSTRRLVDSRAEHDILERLIEDAKPPLPREPGTAAAHYLLATPFRYPPLRHGSRFSTRHEPAIWYGSTRLRTALAETAYYRLLFLEGTAADLGILTVELTAFQASYRTTRGIDLTRPPFREHGAVLSAPDSYAESQKMGAAMRAAGVEAFRFASARDPRSGRNVGLFTPRALASGLPENLEGWTAVLERAAVEFVRRDLLRTSSLRFPRECFEVDGRLPSPAP